MADPASSLADRIEAALDRIDAARARTAAKLSALEQVVEASVAELDSLFTAVEPR